MLTISSAWPRRVARVAAGLTLLFAGACAAPGPGPVASVGPVPPGLARVWVFRVWFPEDSADMPAVSLNGNVIGYARSGESFYRDIPAGTYHATVASYGQDLYQAQDIALAPGQELHLEVQSLPSWASQFNYRRGTYYVAAVQDRIAAMELAQTRLGTGY